MRYLLILWLGLIGPLTGEAFSEALAQDLHKSDFAKGLQVRGDFVKIKAGSFWMGSCAPQDVRGVRFQCSESEAGRDIDEQRHRVFLSRDFWIKKFEETQAEWVEVMGHNPSTFSGLDRPVERVTWHAVQDYIEKKNALLGLDCGDQRTLKGFKKALQTPGCLRLPSEAEWEYAARGGQMFFNPKSQKTRGPSARFPYSFGEDTEALEQYAWYLKNSQRKTQPVGQLQANPAGLFDVHGNVWEWVYDRFEIHKSQASTDPLGPTDPSYKYRVFRGGSYDLGAASQRSAARHLGHPDFPNFPYVGFRLAMTAE